jgi:hypothetical protein
MSQRVYLFYTIETCYLYERCKVIGKKSFSLAMSLNASSSNDSDDDHNFDVSSTQNEYAKVKTEQLQDDDAHELENEYKRLQNNIKDDNSDKNTKHMNNNNVVNEPTEYETWKNVHQMLLEAVQATEQTVTILKIQKRYWLEEICSNLTNDGKLAANSTWRLNRLSSTSPNATSAARTTGVMTNTTITNATKKMKQIGNSSNKIVDKVGKRSAAKKSSASSEKPINSTSKKRKAADDSTLQKKKSKLFKSVGGSMIKSKNSTSKEPGKGFTKKEKSKQDENDDYDDEDDDHQKSANQENYDVDDFDSDDDENDRSTMKVQPIKKKKGSIVPKIKLQPRAMPKTTDSTTISSSALKIRKAEENSSRKKNQSVKLKSKSKKGRLSSYDDMDDEVDSQVIQQSANSFASDDGDNHESDDDAYSSMHTPNRRNDVARVGASASSSSPNNYSIIANATLQQFLQQQQQQQHHVSSATSPATTAATTALLGHHNVAAAAAALLSSPTANNNPEVWLSALAAAQQQQQQQAAVAAVQSLPPNILVGVSLVLFLICYFLVVFANKMFVVYF